MQPQIKLWDRPDRLGLLSNISFAILLAITINGFIALSNPSAMSARPTVPLLPPGYVIGIVWVFLFAGLGTARWLLLVSPSAERHSQQAVFYLILFCLSYPLYTVALKSEITGLVGNIAIICFALIVALRIRHISRLAAALVSLVVCWVSFATVLVVEQLRLQS